jgi:hypothetical protein
VYDEEGFIYIVYEYPEGGDLAALILEESRTFTEGFAKKIATALLEALIFLHSNGIMHGAVTPSNVIFTSPATVPGWADQCKLTFFRVDSARSTTVFQDIQDLAFTVVSTMRRTPGLLSRTFFTPDILQKKEWSHVTDDFVDFIEQLWYCEEKYRMAETFTSHPWLQSAKTKGVVDSADSPAALLSQSVRDKEDKTIEGYLYFKMREKKNGRRQWHKRWAVVRHHMLLMYLTPAEDTVDNQELCQAINLKRKNIFIYSMGKHDFMFGLQDTVLQQTVVWLRFDSDADCTRWKVFLTSRYDKEMADLDPNSDANQMKKILAPKNSNFASSLASNLANNIVAAQYRENLSPEALGKDCEACFVSWHTPLPHITSHHITAVDLFVFIHSFIHSSFFCSCIALHVCVCMSEGGEKEAKAMADSRTRAHAEALVQAVDDVAKEYSKQIEAQASSYIRKSKMLQLLRSNKLSNKVTGASFNHSLSPYPSEQKCRIHPSIKWDMRAEELMLVQVTGTPVNRPIAKGEQWFIIDATWFKHWITFVASSRRRAPPGPIDNLWMVNPLTEMPYEHMIEDTDENGGDFRRVPPQIWELFELWYGGGPAISVTGPPTEDTRRWTLHIEKIPDGAVDEGGNLVELMGKLHHPEDILQVGGEKEEKHLVVDLHKGTRRPSIAEMSLLAKVGGFNDAGHDKVDTGLDAIVDSGSSEEEDSDEEQEKEEHAVSETNSQISTLSNAGVYTPLTKGALAIFDNVESDEEELKSKSEAVKSKSEAVEEKAHSDKPASDKPASEKPAGEKKPKENPTTKPLKAEPPAAAKEMPIKKRSSIFSR